MSKLLNLTHFNICFVNERMSIYIDDIYRIVTIFDCT